MIKEKKNGKKINLWKKPLLDLFSFLVSLWKAFFDLGLYKKIYNQRTHTHIYTHSSNDKNMSVRKIDEIYGLLKNRLSFFVCFLLFLNTERSSLVLRILHAIKLAINNKEKRNMLQLILPETYLLFSFRFKWRKNIINYWFNYYITFFQALDVEWWWQAWKVFCW